MRRSSSSLLVRGCFSSFSSAKKACRFWAKLSFFCSQFLSNGAAIYYLYSNMTHCDGKSSGHLLQEKGQAINQGACANVVRVAAADGCLEAFANEFAGSLFSAFQIIASNPHSNLAKPKLCHDSTLANWLSLTNFPTQEIKKHIHLMDGLLMDITWDWTSVATECTHRASSCNVFFGAYPFQFFIAYNNNKKCDYEKQWSLLMAEIGYSFVDWLLSFVPE